MKILRPWCVWCGGVLVAGLLWGCAKSSTSRKVETSVAEVAAKFKDYRRMTEGMVFVNPEIAAMCRTPSKDEVNAARDKFGPHANTGVVIYMNDAAANAFVGKSNVFPVGAVVVKEKQMLSGMVHDGKAVSNGVGGMIKRAAGYDSEYGDWEYFYFDDVKQMESGRISSCVQCHSSAREKDFVFGNWAELAGAEGEKNLPRSSQSDKERE